MVVSQFARESGPTRPRVVVSVNLAVGFGRGVLSGVCAFNRVHRVWDLTIVPSWDIALDRLGSEVDGIVAQVGVAEAELVARHGPIAVSVDDVADRFPLPSVINDNVAVGELAARYLLDRGFRRFAFHGDAGRYYSDQRLAGFARVLAQRGASLSVSPHAGVGSDRDGVVVDWVGSLPSKTGVFVCHDSAAHALVRLALRCGRRVPEDLAVLGTDNDQLICETGPVPISSIATASEKIGFEAAAMLHRLLTGRGEKLDAPRCVQPLGVVTRQSSDVLAVDDPYVAAAMRYIRDHLAQRFGVDDLVAALPISRRFLETLFRRTLGRSPGEEIRRQRMDRACELLRTTDLSISDIGRACGFRDTALFSHAFRQSMQTTPTAYRRAGQLGGHDPPAIE
jgi:LacI family transcriptional regulator